jgi:hypothetical protein
MDFTNKFCIETKRPFKPFYFQASAPIVVVVKQVDA